MRDCSVYGIVVVRDYIVTQCTYTVTRYCCSISAEAKAAHFSLKIEK